MKLKPENFLLYSDEELLVIGKPAGLPTLPDGYDPAAPNVKDLFSDAFGPLWIVHRLDRETSGILAFARTPGAHRALNTQFETRRVAKLYHALIKGSPGWDERVVKLRLRPDGDRQHRTVIDPRKGKTAVTHLKILERYRGYSLVEARPETGRTHQIRVHLSAVGFPIAADAVYGDGAHIILSQVKPGYRPGKGEERPLLGRLGLHAWSLELEHPVSNEKVLFQASYPKDFGAAVTQLRKTRTGVRE